MDAASPDDAFAALADDLLREGDVEEGKAFHARALKAGGRIFAMHVSGRFVVKLPAERCTELIRDGGGHPFRSGAGRVMREWVAFEPDRVSDWPGLAGEALAFNRAAAGSSPARRRRGA